MPCPYCHNTSYSPSFLPSTRFNNKTFTYLKCGACGVIYIDPLPDAADYAKMYPPDYQGGVNAKILEDKYIKLPGLRFTYGFQFDLLRKHGEKKLKLLDYGCGHANFVLNARHDGFACDGTEYNEEHVGILKKEIPSGNFYTITEFLDNKDLKYDVIRLSNVLEHLDDPNQILHQLIDKLNPGGMLLIEGPIETNFNPAFLVRKMYFSSMNKIKKGYVADHVPTHITFTNAQNQLSFLNKFGLQVLEYKLGESTWPFPERFNSYPGIGNKLKYLVGRLSIALSKLTKSWGNTFIYLGRKS